MSAAEPLSPVALLARIRQEGVRRTAQALRKPPLPSSLLQALADLPVDEAPEARAFVAAYPLSPSHLLEALAAQSPSTTVLVVVVRLLGQQQAAGQERAAGWQRAAGRIASPRPCQLPMRC